MNYPELQEPVLTFSEIVSMLLKLSDEELEALDETQFALNLISSAQ